jgi:hypothetical protein
MVRRGSFVKDESGISLTEGLLTFPIVMLVFAAFVEFGFAMFQWNQTVKALQLGARVAAVSDWMLDEDDVALLFPVPTVVQVGTTMPADGLSRSCSTDNTSDECTAGLDRLVNDAGGRWPGMRSFNPRIGTANVVITYERSGLGYYGRPGGAVTTIRLEVRDVTFDLLIIGALLGLDTITIPAMPVTVTSEDLETDSGA